MATPAELTQTWRTWEPLIGPGYARALVPVRRRFTYSILSYVFGLFLMVFLAMGLRDSPFVSVEWVTIVLVTIVVLFLGATAVGFYGLYAFGREMRKDLAGAGFPTDRRAPMQYPRLFEEWLDRNALTSETIVSVGNARHGEQDDSRLSGPRPIAEEDR